MQRNYLWFAPVLVVGVVLLVCGMAAGILTLMKSSEVYSGAMNLVKSSPSVTAALGTPVKDGFFFTGRISESGTTGMADISVPVSGPKGGAKVYVSATRSRGQWHYNYVTVQIDATGPQIEVADTNSLAAPVQ
jgi:hypothetical protein